ncbi:MAG: hypothetical protein A2Y38_06365 [Spirochaetes bacterium GWB1_59_5]|nr:MAG: hypothetical protein A2Y38_06365 [Spirochaetes bacterium GWB1_59_5]
MRTTWSVQCDETGVTLVKWTGNGAYIQVVEGKFQPVRYRLPFTVLRQAERLGSLPEALLLTVRRECRRQMKDKVFLSFSNYDPERIGLVDETPVARLAVR